MNKKDRIAVICLGLALIDIFGWLFVPFNSNIDLKIVAYGLSIILLLAYPCYHFTFEED